MTSSTVARLRPPRAVAIAGLAALISGGWTASPAQAQAGEPAAKLVERFVEAFNRHDVEALVALAHEEIEWLSVAGAEISIETRGKAALAESLAGYFRSCPTCRSAIEVGPASGSFLSALERATWEAGGETRSQTSLSVYEIEDGLVRRVWYYPSTPEPPSAPAAQPSPHAKHSGREIKALSAEEVDQLLTGQGMGLALPAELNGYPGPKHVLELDAELGLSEDQRRAVRRVHDAMLEQAQKLGRQIVEAERRLDALFAGAEATPEALRAALDHLATLQAALRHTHLHAHLETKALLTEAQVARYTHLRGYAAEATHHGHQHGHQ